MARVIAIKPSAICVHLKQLISSLVNIPLAYRTAQYLDEELKRPFQGSRRDFNQFSSSKVRTKPS